MKRIIFLMTVMLFVLFSVVSVYALEDGIATAAAEEVAYEGETSDTYDILTPDQTARGNSAPKKYWNLGNTSYAGSFTSMRSHVYTNYYFSPNSSGILKLTIDTAWQTHPSTGFNPNLTIKLIRKSDKKVVYSNTYTTAAINRTLTYKNLSTSEYYYYYIELSETSSSDSIQGSLVVKRG